MAEHFPGLSAGIHARLALRGIDPERSAAAWLQAILDGDFPITSRGLPVGPRDALRGPKRKPMTPIPLAAVIP